MRRYLDTIFIAAMVIQTITSWQLHIRLQHQESTLRLLLDALAPPQVRK